MDATIGGCHQGMVGQSELSESGTPMSSQVDVGMMRMALSLPRVLISSSPKNVMPCGYVGTMPQHNYGLLKPCFSSWIGEDMLHENYELWTAEAVLQQLDW